MAMSDTYAVQLWPGHLASAPGPDLEEELAGPALQRGGFHRMLDARRIWGLTTDRELASESRVLSRLRARFSPRRIPTPHSARGTSRPRPILRGGGLRLPPVPPFSFIVYDERARAPGPSLNPRA